MLGKLEEYIQNLVNNSHGSVGIPNIREELKKEEKTKEREKALAPFLVSKPISWEEIKEKVWPNDSQAQEKNKFFFLQGDIIDTSMVLELGVTNSDQEHRLWMVLSPDCDAVRAKYIQVAKVLEVNSSEYNEEERKVHKQNYSIATQLKSPHIFPLGKIFSEDDSSYYAVFKKPFFIDKEDKPYASVVLSLKTEGWHLLNALLQEKFTRSQNIDEAMKIRAAR